MQEAPVKPAFQIEVQNGLHCPECGSTKLFRDGFRYPANGQPVQRWLCRNCGFRFSEKRKNLKTKRDNNNKRQVCVAGSNPASKNLAKAVLALTETDGRTTSGQAGAAAPNQTTQSQADVKGEILDFAWWLKKNGYSEATIRTWTSALKTLVFFGANLNEPEHVKQTLVYIKCVKGKNKGASWSEKRKRDAIMAYTAFLKKHGKTWEPPHCNIARKIPFIPLEQELDALIAGCGKKTSTFLQLLKETGMRAGEAASLKWTDIDFQNRVITLNTPEKHGNPRMFNISGKLLEMLNRLPKTSEKVFPCTLQSLKTTFTKSRTRVASKLQNPRLLKVTFHTFRHWKATTLYHQTRDPLLVKEFLGHKSLDSTLLYVQINKALFNEENDEFIVKTAQTNEEIKALLEVGFQYVCSQNGTLFFRKRK